MRLVRRAIVLSLACLLVASLVTVAQPQTAPGSGYPGSREAVPSLDYVYQFNLKALVDKHQSERDQLYEIARRALDNAVTLANRVAQDAQSVSHRINQSAVEHDNAMFSYGLAAGGFQFGQQTSMQPMSPRQGVAESLPIRETFNEPVRTALIAELVPALGEVIRQTLLDVFKQLAQSGAVQAVPTPAPAR